MTDKNKPALLGGSRLIPHPHEELFAWPIIYPEDEEAVLEVLRRGAMSGIDVTMQFEEEFARWIGSRYALGFNNGTSSVLAALYACGLRAGDEVISPSITYWASTLPCFSLGVGVVFADILPDSLCIDPQDLERKITERTKAVMVVHYLGHPADMDPILRIAQRHELKVIEDVSHAQGGLYKGRKLGTFGHVAAISLMSGKSLVAGEGGMLVTDSREAYERAVAWGHYERFDGRIASPELAPYRGLPLGGCKNRMHQLSSALGRVQLRHYERRMMEIDRAMNTFWDLLSDTPGVRAHRVSRDSGSTMGGWYAPHGLYVPEELEGLSVSRFCEAVSAEGFLCTPGVNRPLHLHPVFRDCDVYGTGRPTAYAGRDILPSMDDLPVSERINALTFSIPWFKRYDREKIGLYADAFRKVAASCRDLKKGDRGNPPDLGDWHLFR